MTTKIEPDATKIYQVAVTDYLANVAARYREFLAPLAKTRTGLRVYARLDEGSYPKGIKVSDADIATVNLTGDAFHPEWNYTIKPRAK